MSFPLKSSCSSHDFHSIVIYSLILIYFTTSALNFLTGLKAVSLATNQISQLLIGDLNHCTDLKILQLEHNLISTVAVGALEKHENLKVINIDH